MSTAAPPVKVTQAKILFIIWRSMVSGRAETAGKRALTQESITEASAGSGVVWSRQAWGTIQWKKSGPELWLGRSLDFC